MGTDSGTPFNKHEGAPYELKMMAENGMNRVPGTDVPIMDVTAVLMKTTEAAIALHDIGGMNVSRRDYYRMPPASLVDTVRNIYFPQD